ncbi:hypothetical protein AB1L07_25855 [Niallia alba]
MSFSLDKKRVPFLTGFCEGWHFQVRALIEHGLGTGADYTLLG